MSSPAQDNSGAPALWQVDNLRLTVFASDAGWLPIDGWWSAVTGAQPDAQHRNQKAGLQLDAGVWNGCKLTLHSQAGRVEWRLGPNQAAPSESSLLIGRLGDTLPAFSAALRSWLEGSCPQSIRIALGVGLMHPVESSDEAMAILRRFLTWVVGSPDFTDFVYQINRPRKSAASVDALTLNRLSRWSITNLMATRAQIEAGSFVLTASPALFGPSLDLDLNTSQNRKAVLPAESLPKLLAEFGDLAVELAEKGDIP